jgi:hypothetical protein
MIRLFTKTAIEKYFLAEKQESLLFLVIGITAVVASLVFFLAIKTSFYKGIAIPLLFVGLLLGIVGFTVYKRSDGDRLRNVYAYDMNPSALKEKELPRMRAVMKNFVIYRYTEIILFLLGAGLFIYFTRSPGNAFWRGVGLGLAIMALLALFGDYFGEKRGKRYIEGIESFVNK